MNFPLKQQGTHMSINTGKSISRNTEILNVVTHALLFVAAWAVFNRHQVFGLAVALHGVLILFTAVTSAVMAHMLFYLFFDWVDKKEFPSFKVQLQSVMKRTWSGTPIVTALILGLAVHPGIALYVIGITVFFAEILAKLLFGGYGQNIFNPVAFGLVFILLAFGATEMMAGHLPDAVTAATPLVGLSQVNWMMDSQEIQRFMTDQGGFLNMLLGLVPGSFGETARLASLLALAYMIYKKVLDWAIPLFYLGTIFVITLVYGFSIGAGWWYPFVHLLTGGIVYGSIFMITDPVTSPINRQGKAIFAILLAMFTLLIRLNTPHPEGVAFAILLMNMFVPFIDAKTANVTLVDTHKKITSVGITFVVALVVVIGFTSLIHFFG
ncbi:MAG: RnfABCDGE type electron transport complex subunit D [Defluviitaleaceae bacterium]|nr:RnfABCDGE type electron transport complex subunit D [Defluviitaleaceae bacterium]